MCRDFNRGNGGTQIAAELRENARALVGSRAHIQMVEFERCRRTERQIRPVPQRNLQSRIRAGGDHRALAEPRADCKRQVRRRASRAHRSRSLQGGDRAYRRLFRLRTLQRP